MGLVMAGVFTYRFTLSLRGEQLNQLQQMNKMWRIEEIKAELQQIHRKAANELWSLNEEAQGHPHPQDNGNMVTFLLGSREGVNQLNHGWSIPRESGSQKLRMVLSWCIFNPIGADLPAWLTFCHLGGSTTSKTMFRNIVVSQISRHSHITWICLRCFLFLSKP